MTGGAGGAFALFSIRTGMPSNIISGNIGLTLSPPMSTVFIRRDAGGSVGGGVGGGGGTLGPRPSVSTM